MADAGWFPDPLGRFTLRYFDGSQWTEHVMLGDRQTVDPDGINRTGAGVAASSGPAKSANWQAPQEPRPHNPPTTPGEYPSDNDVAELRRLRRADRLAFWSVVAPVVFVMMGVAALVALVVILLGGNPGRWIPVVGVVVGVIFAKYFPRFAERLGRHNEQRRQASRTQAERADIDRQRFTNFAFSQSLPTWHGWRRDVGNVVIDSNGMTINGLKHRLELQAPMTAEIYQGKKYTYWTMVEVTGVSTQGRQVVVYLIAEGAPRTKFSADPDDLHRRGAALVEAIRNAFPRDDPR